MAAVSSVSPDQSSPVCQSVRSVRTGDIASVGGVSWGWGMSDEGVSDGGRLMESV